MKFNWYEYKNLKNKLEGLNEQLKLEANDNILKIFNVVKEKMFQSYECSINANNEINSNVAEVVVNKWIKENLYECSPYELKNWINNLNWDEYKTVRDYVEDLVYCEFYNLFLKLNIDDFEFYSESLIYNLVKTSKPFTFVPRTEENVDMFLNGSTQYLNKEVISQDLTDSPIEEIMYNAISELEKKYKVIAKREYPVYDEGRLEIRYSLDIAILKNDKLIMDIECDGLSFHSNFIAMASDRARDRWLLIRGVPTMRFTSREIFNDTDDCIIQIEHALKNVLNWNS